MLQLYLSLINHSPRPHPADVPPRRINDVFPSTWWKELGAECQFDRRLGGGFIFLPIISHSKPASQPRSAVCVPHELCMSSIKTLNSWFLRNLPAATPARLPLRARLLKQQHMRLTLCSNVCSDHHKAPRHRAIFSSISSLWRAAGPAADFLAWRRNALQ